LGEVKSSSKDVYFAKTLHVYLFAHELKGSRGLRK